MNELYFYKDLIKKVKEQKSMSNQEPYFFKLFDVLFINHFYNISNITESNKPLVSFNKTADCNTFFGYFFNFFNIKATGGGLLDGYKTPPIGEEKTKKNAYTFVFKLLNMESSIPSDISKIEEEFENNKNTFIKNLKQYPNILFNDEANTFFVNLKIITMHNNVIELDYIDSDFNPRINDDSPYKEGLDGYIDSTSDEPDQPASIPTSSLDEKTSSPDGNYGNIKLNNKKAMLNAAGWDHTETNLQEQFNKLMEKQKEDEKKIQEQQKVIVEELEKIDDDTEYDKKIEEDKHTSISGFVEKFISFFKGTSGTKQDINTDEETKQKFKLSTDIFNKIKDKIKSEDIESKKDSFIDKIKSVFKKTQKEQSSSESIQKPNGNKKKIQGIGDRFVPDGFEYNRVEADGNCLYYSVLEASRDKNIQPGSEFDSGTPIEDVVLLKSALSEYIRSDDNYNSCPLAATAHVKEEATEDEIVSFFIVLHMLDNIGVWGDEQILTLIECFYSNRDLKIKVFNMRSKSWNRWGNVNSTDRNVITLYFTGAHYDWLKPIQIK